MAFDRYKEGIQIGQCTKFKINMTNIHEVNWNDNLNFVQSIGTNQIKPIYRGIMPRSIEDY